MLQVVNKAKEANGGSDTIMVCVRGASFGYNTLISDMRGLAIMRETNCPVVFDATHSVQQPGGQGDKSGGQREHVPVLARALRWQAVLRVFLWKRIQIQAKPCLMAQMHGLCTKWKIYYIC